MFNVGSVLKCNDGGGIASGQYVEGVKVGKILGSEEIMGQSHGNKF